MAFEIGHRSCRAPVPLPFYSMAILHLHLHTLLLSVPLFLLLFSLELPILSAHWTLLARVLFLQPLEYAMYVEGMITLAPY